MSRFSQESEAPAVIVLTLILLVTLFLTAVTRLGTKLWKFGSLFLDDYYIVLATASSITQSVLIASSVGAGYGSHLAKLDAEQINTIMKYQYAATFFFILGLVFSKLSLVHFVQNLTANSRDRLFCAAVQVVVAAWGLSGLIASAFQCSPNRWDYIHGVCFDRRAWWMYFGVSNIATDAVIIGHAIRMILRVQTTVRRKLSIVSLLSTRFIVIAAAVAQLYLLNTTIDSVDQTYDTWSTTVVAEFIQCMSIITASTLQLKPFLANLQSSGMQLGGMTRYNYSARTEPSRSKSFFSRSGHGQAAEDNTQELKHIDATSRTTVTASKQDMEPDEESMSSQTHIIRETRTWAVTEEIRESQPCTDLRQ